MCFEEGLHLPASFCFALFGARIASFYSSSVKNQLTWKLTDQRGGGERSRRDILLCFSQMAEGLGRTLALHTVSPPHL